MGEDEEESTQQENQAINEGAQNNKKKINSFMNKAFGRGWKIKVAIIFAKILGILLAILAAFVFIMAIINWLQSFNKNMSFTNASVVWDDSYTRDEFILAVRGFSEKNKYTDVSGGELMDGDLSGIVGENRKYI